MFDASFKELLLILVLGLLVLGPERLPKVAAEIGKWVARARRTATQLRRQLEREIELDDAIQSRRERERREAQRAAEAAARQSKADASAAQPGSTNEDAPYVNGGASSGAANPRDDAAAATADGGTAAQRPGAPVEPAASLDAAIDAEPHDSAHEPAPAPVAEHEPREAEQHAEESPKVR